MIQLGMLLALLSAMPREEVLDSFSYSTQAGARSAWIGSEATSPVDVAIEGGRSIVTVKAPFAASPNLERAVVDRSVSLDLAAPGQFDLEIAVDPPQACAHLTLYFRSGSGWYGCSGGVVKEGWQNVRFSKAGFRIEGTPAGWDKIDGIRIACWRGRGEDAVIRLRRLAARWSDVAILIPSAATAPENREIRSALATAEMVGSMLDELGLGADAIEDTLLPSRALGRRRIVIIAHHPSMSSETVAALVRFVEGGGKVFACYNLPDELGRALGFKPGRYVKPEPGTLAEIRLDGQIEGLPPAARQASWNIATAEPAGHGARVIGRWHDNEGKPVDLPALLLSERGAYFTHILLGDDRPAKRQMLAAVLGHLEPGLWQQMAEAELERSGRVGHCQNLAMVADHVKKHARPEALAALAEAQQSDTNARRLFKTGPYFKSVEAARGTHELLARAYLLAQSSPEVEARAWWNHSGTGAYPGDWDRTARELAKAGFNMVLPNMLWAGRAHYASDVLPRSETFKEHGDQVAQCVAAAKKHGLEVHVWKVNYNLSGAPRAFVERLRGEGRLQVFVGGEPQNWLCPSHPENMRLEVDSMIEVAKKYDVDGLHFDYIRYPGSQSCYCDGCRERFQAGTGLKVEKWPDECRSGRHKAAYNQWRCEQISRVVRAVHEEGKRLRPSLKISAAVFGAYPSCRESVAQDWPEWIKQGWLDFVCPMDYTESDIGFRGLVENQLALVGGRIPMYPGIGATASNSSLSADRVAGQILAARQLGAAGFTIFNLSESTARDLLPGLSLGATATPARPR